MAGVHEGGQIWMLCTPAIYDYPHTFAREAKRYVNSRTEKLLWNFVDERNKVHIKLLRFLGFKFLRRFPYGPNNLSFIEFAVCSPAAIGPAVSAVGSAAQASQANKEKRRNYEHKLKIRERKWMQTRATYATKKFNLNKKLI